MALNEEEIEALSKEDYERKLKRSYDILTNAGAHYVIDSITELPPVIDDINRRLAAGEKPWTLKAMWHNIIFFISCAKFSQLC